MTREELLARDAQIGDLFASMQTAWPKLALEIRDRIQWMTESLISENDEQTRGGIKTLRDLLNLPETLQQEREAIQAGLSEESDPAL